MTSRKRSIRFKITSILFAPILSLAAFWGLAVYTALRNLLAVDASSFGVWSSEAFVRAVVRLALVGGLGLLALVVSVVIAIRVSRPVVREMRGLSAGTRDFADRRLPMIAERLRRGEATDGDFDAPSYTFTTTETDQLVNSFVTARRAAVQATVQEAAVRRGIGDVFLNLARRNQALLHRQLGLLDTMEREVSEPEELDKLFQLDQLATRMRRHAEGLVILSGAAPGRGWRNSVPLVDVMRGAVAEVEDYPRVSVVPVTQASLAGPAVADAIHLFAELVENATLFSPPHTTVRVTGQFVGNGFAVEIEDRGLGMSDKALAEANELLENSPEFDLSDSTQLGFFVISRLAQRHGIKVSLRRSPFDGVTAVVLMPWSIVIQEDAQDQHDQQRRHGQHGEQSQGQEQEQEQRQGVEQEPPAADQQIPETPQHAGVTSSATGQSASGMPAPAGDQTSDPASEGLDLPQRTRQAHLAPQLHEDPQGGYPDSPNETQLPPGHGEGDGRRPDQVRSRLGSIQEGWLRGRSRAEPDSADHGQLAATSPRSTEEEGG